MSDYKQYRADFAKAAWLDQMNHGYKASDAAFYAVEHADALIAELERTEAQDRLHGILAEVPQPEPPTPALPRLNTGWKWAPGDGTHKITPFDVWRENDGRLSAATMIGMPCNLENCLATPDWHNPENIESPGEGWRFLVKGENAQPGDEFYIGAHMTWRANDTPLPTETREWTHRTTRPLPPVLADEKEVQP